LIFAFESCVLFNFLSLHSSLYSFTGYKLLLRFYLYLSIRSLRSFVHSFAHSFIHSFIYSFIYSFIRLFIHSFSHSFIHSFSRLFITFLLMSSLIITLFLVNSLYCLWRLAKSTFSWANFFPSTSDTNIIHVFCHVFVFSSFRIIIHIIISLFLISFREPLEQRETEFYFQTLN